MRKLRTKSIATITLASTLAGPLGEIGIRADGHGHGKTATPIKHVIVIIGENRTFDNIYATYEPKHGQHVSNLLSRGIVNADGTPGWNAAAATQFQLANIDPVAFFVDTNKLNNPGKTAYSPFLPTPEAGSAPPQAVTLTQFHNAPGCRHRRSTR